MHVPFLSPRCTATWLASMTAFTLVACHVTHQARSDPTPEYPQGYDAKTCPLDATKIGLQPAPVNSDALTQLAERLPPASMASKIRRDLTPDELSHVCRQVASFTFPPGHYPQLDTTIWTSTVQPGLYVVSVKANKLIRTLVVADYALPHPKDYIIVHNNQFDYIGGRFQISTPVRLHIVLSFWSANVAGGEIAMFKLGPRGYVGPPSSQE